MMHCTYFYFKFFSKLFRYNVSSEMFRIVCDQLRQYCQRTMVDAWLVVVDAPKLFVFPYALLSDWLNPTLRLGVSDQLSVLLVFPSVVMPDPSYARF